MVLQMTGGAIRSVYGDSLTLTNCSFANNKAYLLGGAVMAVGRVVATHSLFVENICSNPALIYHQT
ncbi:hypothetical protein SARC_15446, partial [Sphaeroforma arctica JP610]